MPVGKLVHAILDNHATHKHPKVRAWLDQHERWTCHYTPTSGLLSQVSACVPATPDQSRCDRWRSAVESFFSALTRRGLCRGASRSLVNPQAAIHRYLAEHNAHAKPFVWTTTPERPWPSWNL